MERPLPLEQALSLERGLPPEQPHQRTLEHSKFEAWGQVEEKVSIKSQRSKI